MYPNRQNKARAASKHMLNDTKADKERVLLPLLPSQSLLFCWQSHQSRRRACPWSFGRSPFLVSVLLGSTFLELWFWSLCFWRFSLLRFCRIWKLDIIKPSFKIQDCSIRWRCSALNSPSAKLASLLHLFLCIKDTS